MVEKYRKILLSFGMEMGRLPRAGQSPGRTGPTMTSSHSSMMRTPTIAGLSRLYPTSTSNPCVPRAALVPCNPTLSSQAVPGTSRGNPRGRRGTVTAACWKGVLAQGWSTDLCASRREYQARRQFIGLKCTAYGSRRA